MKQLTDKVSEMFREHPYKQHFVSPMCHGCRIQYPIYSIAQMTNDSEPLISMCPLISHSFINQSNFQNKGHVTSTVNCQNSCQKWIAKCGQSMQITWNKISFFQTTFYGDWFTTKTNRELVLVFIISLTQVFPYDNNIINNYCSQSNRSIIVLAT